MSKVNIRLGYTINCGDFESYRIDIGIEDETRDKESVPEAFDRVYNWVEAQLENKVKEAKADL